MDHLKANQARHPAACTCVRCEQRRLGDSASPRGTPRSVRRASVLFAFGLIAIAVGAGIWWWSGERGEESAIVQATTLKNGETVTARRNESLRFLPTPTPDPQLAKLADIKAVVEQSGIDSSLRGMARTAAFYLLVDECGGPITIRDGLIKATVPRELLINDEGTRWLMLDGNIERPLRVSLWQNWSHDVEWQVLVRVRGMWEQFASGQITSGCAVRQDRGV